MKGWATIIAACAFTACSQPAATTAPSTTAAHQEQVAALPPVCPDTPPDGFVALDCRVAHGADNYMVHYAAKPADAKTGEITVEAGSQQLKESGVSAYYAPEVKDVDGDGADDVLITIDGGAANATWAFWRNMSGHYVRLGELNGANIARTRDGFLAMQGHSSAAESEVDIFRVGPTALTPLLSLDVVAEGDDQGHVTHLTCTLMSAPGLASLHLTSAQAQAKYCADPAARMFDQ